VTAAEPAHACKGHKHFSAVGRFAFNPLKLKERWEGLMKRRFKEEIKG
jgi:hypothetical protein